MEIKGIWFYFDDIDVFIINGKRIEGDKFREKLLGLIEAETKK